MDFDNAFDPGIEDEYDDSWLDQYSLPEIFSIARETSELDYANQFMPKADATSSDVDVYPTGGRGSASAGANGSGSFPNESVGGDIWGSLETFTKENKNLIGLGAAGLSAWAQTVSSNRNASQAADAAEMQRQQRAQDQADAIARKEQQDQDALARAEARDLVLYEREQQKIKEQRDYEREMAKQKQADAMAQLAFSRSSSSGGGGGGGFDPAAARAARVSASIVGMKPTKTGIVNSNIWGNALNTLQRK